MSKKYLIFEEFVTAEGVLPRRGEIVMAHFVEAGTGKGISSYACYGSSDGPGWYEFPSGNPVQAPLTWMRRVLASVNVRTEISVTLNGDE